jgi:CIC family chloride channel protein
MLTDTREKWRHWLARWNAEPRIFRFLSLRVRFAGAYRAVERHSVLFWAGVVGILGGLSSVLFRKALGLMTHGLTGHSGGMVEIFSSLPPWQRLITSTFGGIAAGLIIHFGGKLASSRKHTTDYMEAVVLGDGYLSFRSSMTKTLSSMFSIASGASIGREGPMVQLAALLASLVGRTRRWSIARRRLILACGAAAGIASAYNAPIAGALFVAEIVLGSIAMETLGPLLFSTVLATQTVHFLAGGAPMFEIPPFHLNSGLELIEYLALGVLAGLIAPWFLRALRGSEKLFGRIRLPVYWRTGLGGLIIGILLLYRPQVCGNGYSVVSGILQEQWLWSSLAVILLLKVVATCSSFGSGAVGGVFTPTLFVGASIGFLFGQVHHALGLGPLPAPGAFALTGMGMFLAATTHAPLMAILMIFEMTLDYQLILPLMLGCVVAYFTSHGVEARSIYSGTLQRKGADYFARRLSELRVGGLMKTDPVRVRENTEFGEIAKHFVAHTFRFLYVVDENDNYLGAVCLEDVKEFLGATSLTHLVIARDLLGSGPPAIAVSASLEEALEKFTWHRGERLPVVADGPLPRLLGSLAKTDLLLALTERLPVNDTPLAAEPRPK